MNQNSNNVAHGIIRFFWAIIIKIVLEGEISMKSKLMNYVWITTGALIFAIGINTFLVPMKISVGGIASIATIFLYKFAIPLSATNLLLNAVLFIIGYKYLGKSALLKTAYGVICLSLFLELTSRIPQISQDYLICAISGGLIMGLGVGIVIRCGGSTGGSDLAAILLNKLIPHFSISKLILIIDLIIIAISALVFQSYKIAFYSAASLYVFTKIADYILTLGDLAKSIYIFSDKAEEISRAIMMHFRRGVTGMHCKGMYSSNDKLMLICISTPKELPFMINLIHAIDPSAFISISDVRKVFGKGFG